MIANHKKKILLQNKIIILLLLVYVVQIHYGIDPIHAKEYAVLSFLKKKTLQISLFQAATDGNTIGIINAIQYNTPLDIQNEQGHTPLILSVLYNQEKAVEALIYGGASVTIQDNQGKTALDYALENPKQNKVIIKLLLDNATNSM